MKRLIIAVCMLITGIAISIGGYVNLKSICRNMSCSVNHHRLVCSKHYGFVGCDGRNDWDNRSFCLV